MKKAFIVSLLFGIIFIVFSKSAERAFLILNTDPPLAYMEENLDELMICANRAGFIIKKPTLRIMKPPFDDKTPNGWAYMGLDLIVLIPYASYETLAHELGHIIDDQTKRKGHPLFVGKEKMDLQSFAEDVKRA